MNFLGQNIGLSGRIFVIAEAGINHNGDLDMALRMVEVAKEVGADAVKFQKRNMETLYRPNVLAEPSNESHSLGVYIPLLKQCEFTLAQHVRLKERCDQVGIKYLCSPWDIESVMDLESMGVEGYKIPSACLSDPYLVEAVAKTGKPLIFSTGMHTWDEIKQLLPTYLEEHKLQTRAAVMHCVSSYPTANRDVGLNVLGLYRGAFAIPVGYSGHERGIPITVAAVALGATIIERHFTLDRTLPGPDHAASLEPVGLETLIRHIRAVEEAVVGEKKMNQGEVVARETLGKALTWARDHEKGELVTKSSFCAMSPGYGVPAYYAEKHIFASVGNRATRAVKKGEIYQAGDVSVFELKVVESVGGNHVP